jgi:hypothetical protein
MAIKARPYKAPHPLSFLLPSPLEFEPPGCSISLPEPPYLLLFLVDSGTGKHPRAPSFGLFFFPLSGASNDTPTPPFLAVFRAHRRPQKPPSPPITTRRRLGKRKSSPTTDSRPPSSAECRPLLHRRHRSSEPRRRQATVPPRRKSSAPVSNLPLIVLVPRI